MNETQRQLLADRLDFLSRDIESEKESVASLERRLANKKANLALLQEEFDSLSEGIDW